MLILMQAPDGGQMYVPEAKEAAYLKDGWIVILRAAPVTSATPAPPLPPVAAETPAADSAPEPADKPKGRGKS